MDAELLKKSDTVCIVGLAPSTRDLALEAPEGVEYWSLNQGHAFLSPELMARMTRWFQVHPYEEMVARQHPELNHLEWLKGATIPVYLEEVHPEVPSSVRYPYEAIGLDLGTYLTSAIAFMLALAIHQKFTMIRLYGVDLASETEYEEQRPCVEHLLGRAIERGIQVWLPPGCPLLKGPLYAKTVMVPTSQIERRMQELITTASYQKEAYLRAAGQAQLCRDLQKAHPAWEPHLSQYLVNLTHKEQEALKLYHQVEGGIRLAQELLATALKGGGRDEPAELVQGSDGLVRFQQEERLYARLASEAAVPADLRFWPGNNPPVDISVRAQQILDEHNRKVISDRRVPG